MRPCPRCGGLVVHVEGCESETIHGLRAEVERLKAELATARDSLQHQSEAAAQGWERAATYLDALNAEKAAHLATRTELDKAVAWLDRCQWARSVIDLDSGPLEVQLATALGRVKRLTAALRGLTTWLSSWRHAVSIRAIGAEQAWAELEGLHNNGCAALAATQDAAPRECDHCGEPTVDRATYCPTCIEAGER